MKRKIVISDPFDGICHAVKKAGEAVASTVGSAGATVLHTAAGAAQSGGHFVSCTFHSAVKDAEMEIMAAKDEIQRVVDSEDKAVLESLAAKKVQEYADIIQSLVKAWPRVVLRLGSEIEVLRHAASQRRVDPKAAAAMKRIATSPELRGLLSKAADRSIISFAVEFGGDVAVVASVAGALGFVTELQNLANVEAYGSVGLSIGASAGGSGDVALGLYTSLPQDYGGPFVAGTLQGDIGIGGGVVVSFGFPDLSFGGFAIPISVGESVNVSVGGGYTFLFVGTKARLSRK